jgi:heme exporter protein D
MWVHVVYSWSNKVIKLWKLLNCLLHALQEENKILDKLHRQKVAEVEKLSQTVRELEEAVLAGGAAANVVRDYQRKVQEMNVTNYPWLAAFLIKYELSQCLFVT